MSVINIRQYCKDCKKVTNHMHGESVGGKKYIECEECGRGK